MKKMICASLVALASLVLAVASAPAQDRAGATNAATEGRWWVNFRVYTRPDGESFQANPGTPHATSHSRYHVEFGALAFFTVGNESRFSFDERRSGFLHNDGSATVQSTGLNYAYSADYQPVFKGDGLVAGSTVRLVLKWAGGNGVSSVGDSIATQTVSADGLQATVSVTSASYRIPVDYHSSEWELGRPQVSPPLDSNDRYETITWKMTRPAMLAFRPQVGARAIPVTEEIEVTQVRPVRREGAQPPPPATADIVVLFSPAPAGAAADSATRARVGEPIALAATVTNRGPSSARRVAATLAIPPALALADPPAPCRRASPGTVRCELGDLDSGGSRRIDFTVKPRLPSAPVVSALVESMTSDPDHSNNIARADIRVAADAAAPAPPPAPPQQPTK